MGKVKEKTTLDLWTLQKEHKEIKKAIKKVQSDVRFYQKVTDQEKRTRMRAETILKGWLRRVKQNYRELRPKLDRTREKVYAVIVEHPGLTYEQIHEAFIKKYGFRAKTDNRVRELFKDKRVVKIKETDGYLHWYPNVDQEVES